MTTARKANEQIRRLRAGLIEARDTLRDHFGPLDESVQACERALWPVDSAGYSTVPVDELDDLPPSRISIGFDV